ncbi:MAG: AAA family ATPase, partial [Caldilineaceae bacterium]|nr:AAA family ATPase [Caldilineaceae bacterium]
MLVNPYIAGNPVGGSEAFVGRADILRTVLRVLKNPGENAIVLYGQRRIGKTSVLLELMRQLPHEGEYQPIYFDLQDKAALPLSTVLRELMQRIAAATSVPAPTVTNDALPEQFQTTFLQAVLQELPLETSLVLLFDEFDVLDNPGEGQAGKEFFPYLRNMLTLSPRLQFGFVIGRRPEDLSSFTLSIFKAIKMERISLLSATDTTALVRLSEQNGSLRWTKEAIAQIYILTGGHPFLTQQLCQELWEATWQDDPTETPLITPAAIDAAVAPTLRSAMNALEWLWDGLRPAQRIVAAALAEAGPDSIDQEELESRLQQSGVRILIGELQDAPRTLQDWDLLEPGKAGYRFRVELLRRWIVQNKPLARVQQEIDFVQPAAENLFLAAYAFYQAGQLEDALPLLRQVVTLNPNHVRGALVLSEILLAQNEVDEAQQLLESLHQYHPSAAQ